MQAFKQLIKDKNNIIVFTINKIIWIIYQNYNLNTHLFNTATYRFKVKKSGIKNSGNGLYSMSNIAANTCLILYDGVYSDTLNNNNTSVYIVDAGSGYIDAKKNSLLPGKYINDVRSHFDYNCEFNYDLFKIKINSKKKYASSITFLRDIKIGEELFINYGEDYWNNLNI